MEDVCSGGVLEIIKRKSDNLKQTMKTRTAMLWLQYLNRLGILQMQEQSLWTTGNYTLKQYTTFCHICIIWSHTTCEVCICVAANDASSARISSRRPPECNGRIPWAALRRSDRCWAGLSTGIIIEQVSMISIKTQ